MAQSNGNTHELIRYTLELPQSHPIEDVGFDLPPCEKINWSASILTAIIAVAVLMLAGFLAVDTVQRPRKDWNQEPIVVDEDWGPVVKESIVSKESK